MTIRHQALLDRQVVGETWVSYGVENEPAVTDMFLLPVQDYRDMGEPEQITVRVLPGEQWDPE